MSTLAIAAITELNFGPEIVGYLKGIDATLTPFGGKYLVHGDPITVLEGNWRGDVVIIEFPDRQNAEAWYASDAYRAIRPLRTENSTGDVILIDTVAPGHRGADILSGIAG